MVWAAEGLRGGGDDGWCLFRELGFWRSLVVFSKCLEHVFNSAKGECLLRHIQFPQSVN